MEVFAQLHRGEGRVFTWKVCATDVDCYECDVPAGVNQSDMQWELQHSSDIHILEEAGVYKGLVPVC